MFYFLLQLFVRFIVHAFALFPPPQVLANNGAFNSSIVLVSVQLWPLPPQPQLVVDGLINSTSFAVNVMLPDNSFRPIQAVTTQVSGADLLL